VAAAKGTAVLDLSGHTVMPGIVGMHNHLFYIVRPNLDSRRHFDDPVLATQMTFSAPRLYLASGITTMRTTGSVETYADLNLKRDIDAGKLPGPHLDVTGPYLEGSQSYFIQMPHLTGPDDARQTVEYWADRGVTSFKAYMNVTRAELKAAIDAAHKRGIKVTGHLCSVTYKEAAELGIDDLEHGFFVNTQLDPEKKPDVCSASQGDETLARMDSTGPEAKDLIATLISHHVAITSTLPVFEGDRGEGHPPLRQQALEAMTPQARDDFFLLRQRPAAAPTPAPAPKIDPALLWKHDLELEHAFVAAGGLLLSGPDPTGRGDVLPGFGDQRGIELLVEGGFSPAEAIRIATLNGAIYLGRDKQIGSVAAGKNADLVVIKGDPSKQISDIENVETVFKDGVGYDSGKLLDSVRGRYGQY
jgi:imidazolonepropionase-like amidohydrolase